MKDNIYTPDKYVIIRVEFKGRSPLYKVLAGWGGGYVYGDSWRLSSNIIKVSTGGGVISLEQESGSIYQVSERSYGFCGITSNIWRSLSDESESKNITIKLFDNFKSFEEDFNEHIEE